MLFLKFLLLLLLEFGLIAVTSAAADAESFDARPYLRADIPPLTKVINFFPVDYTAKFSTSFKFQNLAKGQTSDLSFQIIGIRHVTFVGETVVETNDVTSISIGSSGQNEVISDNPLFTYKFIGTLQGKLLSRESTVGPKWKGMLNQKDNAFLADMIESTFTDKVVGKNEILSTYSFLPKPLGPSGDLGSFASIGSTTGSVETCGVDLSKLRLAVKGVTNGSIVGGFGIKQINNDGCIFNFDGIKVVDVVTGQVLYVSTHLSTASKNDRGNGPASAIIEGSSVIEPIGKAAATVQPGSDDQLAQCVAAPKRTLSGQFPPASISRREEGTVEVAVKIDSGGNVSDAHVTKSSGHPLLDASALAAAAQWTFDPKTCSGMTLAIPQTFQLKK